MIRGCRDLLSCPKSPVLPLLKSKIRELKTLFFLLPLLHMPCRFRMKQVNIVGSSPFSQPSRKMQTLQSNPDVAPADLIVFSPSETSLRIRWEVRKGQTHHTHTQSSNSYGQVHTKSRFSACKCDFVFCAILLKSLGSEFF